MLFVSALLSSTLLPGGSEVLLILRLHEGADPLGLVTAAATGNVLGSLFTFGMGFLGRDLLPGTHRRNGARTLARGEHLFARYGRPALLFAWLPIVGDPLCLAAGLARTPISVFIPLVALGKTARYAFLAWNFMPST